MPDPQGSSPLKVLGLTRYAWSGPSSRYRFYQFQSALAAEGVTLQIAPLLGDWYMDCLNAQRRPPPGRIIAAYLKRIALLLAQRHTYDVLWIEKELLPWLPWGFEKLLPGRTPMVIDFDDNHFVRYAQHHSAAVRALLGHKIGQVVACAAGVTCGNGVLAEQALGHGAGQIAAIPTVVDLALYPPEQPTLPPAPFTIGWIGTRGNAGYLEALRGPLETLAHEAPLKILAIGAPPGTLAGLPIEIVPWSAESEIAALARISLGIMPLPDEPFERGKCGLKLIQYMASWKPTIASPVGANCVITLPQQTGFLASNDAEWLAAFRQLRDNPALQQEMGRQGRLRVEAAYSIKSLQADLADFLRSVRR